MVQAAYGCGDHALDAAASSERRSKLINQDQQQCHTGFCAPQPRENSFDTAPDGFQAALAYLSLMKNSARPSVIYSATCPVCFFEIQRYARYADDHVVPVRFDDPNSDARESRGLDADASARRLHVLHQGMLTSGIRAFLVLWAQMSRYRWLAKVVGFPGLRQIASVVLGHALAPAICCSRLRGPRRQMARFKH